MARVVEPTDSADSEQGGSGAGAAAAEVASASEQVATAQVADALAASEMSDGAGPAEAPAMAGASALGGPRVKVRHLHRRANCKWLWVRTDVLCSSGVPTGRRQVGGSQDGICALHDRPWPNWERFRV